VWQDGGVKRIHSDSTTRRRRRTAEEIAAILQEQRRSGLSLLAFARERQLGYANLRRWRSGQRAQPNAKDAAPQIGAGPGFVPVHIQSEVPAVDYVLDWPDGRSLRIPARFEPQRLRRLLRMLEAMR